VIQQVASGRRVADVAASVGVPEATYYRHDQSALRAVSQTTESL
jgi:hypothetical protein